MENKPGVDVLAVLRRAASREADRSDELQPSCAQAELMKASAEMGTLFAALDRLLPQLPTEPQLIDAAPFNMGCAHDFFTASFALRAAVARVRP